MGVTRMLDDEPFMKLAMDACRHGIETGQTPFGACIVRDRQVVACTHNHVWLETDITAHAEVHCIRQACRALKTIDLSGCVIYSTTEPCPMCFGAIHWAKITRIVYGASINDAKAFGFSELEISNQQMKQLGRSPVQVVGGVMKDQALQLFEQWKSSPSRRAY